MNATSDFEPFWDGLRQRQIRFPACRHCGRVQWYPMKRCPKCFSEAFDWQPVRGPGRLYSWTVVRRDFTGGRGKTPPFVVGLVAFDEVPGTRLITNIVGDEGDLKIDAPVEPIFAKPGRGTPVVHFRLVTDRRSEAT
jgi:uncharacterized OB-fold protein